MSTPVDAGGAFDPANFQTVLLIQVARLYDAQMALLSAINPQAASELYSLHESGRFLGSPPAFSLADDPPES